MTTRELRSGSDVGLPPEEAFHVDGPGGLRLLLRHQPPAGAADHLAPVVYVHGATFPSALSMMFPFGGWSWAQDLAAAGHDVWAFDFAGYGGSQRYPEMDRPPVPGPLGRGDLCAEQLGSVVDVIRDRAGAHRVSLIAHSWGTTVAGRHAVARPGTVDRLVLFGPIVRRVPAAAPAPTYTDGYHLLTVAAQHARFVEDVPPGHPDILVDHEAWARDYLATDASSELRDPPGVRTPLGPLADIEAAWSGAQLYDPAGITAPTCVIRGEWDSLCTDDDARTLFHSLTASPTRRDVKIGSGTHLMHLETSRVALYRESAAFLRGESTPRD